MSIARDIANGTFTPQSTVGDVLDEPLFELELGRGRGISNLDKKARITRPAPLI